MKTYVTVVPDDQIIIVDGAALRLIFTSPINLHALQWREGKGHTEWKDGPNVDLSAEDYDAQVRPFVEAYEAEEARLRAEAEAAEAEYNSLDATRARKLAEIMAKYDAAFGPIEAVYPAKERETWPIQLEEARAVLADPAAETPMLSVMVAQRDLGETVADLAAKVLANNASYRLLAGWLTGQQQGMYATVSAMTSPEEVTAYAVVYTLPEGLGDG